MLKHLLCGATLLFCLTVSAAEREPYLHEVLGDKTYRASWDTMIRGEKDVPEWLRKYARTKAGVGGDSYVLKMADGPYRISDICEPHFCPNSHFYVLFAPGGTTAWESS